MILTAHQPVYLPWLGLFHKIALSDLYIVLDRVQYQRNDWNNRNKVKTDKGETWLTVPVLSKGHLSKNIYEMEINNNTPWARKHWKTIQQSYAKALYFNRYSGFFEDCYSRRWDTLAELNSHMLTWFLDTLAIKTPVQSAGDHGFRERKGDLVLEMCRKMEADIFIFGAQGRDYADEASFRRENITPVFQDYQHPGYPQLHGEFISHLSVIDLLFNCGDESLDILMSGNLDKAGLLECT